MPLFRKDHKPKSSTDPGSTGASPSGKKVDEQALWNALIKGSEAAFVEIYNSYFDLLYNFGRQLCADPELTKDCIQEVFINLRKKRSRLPQVISIKAYLIKSLRNRLITELNRLRDKPVVDLTAKALNFHICPSHENLLINKQTSENQKLKIQKIVEGLSQRQREVVYYFYYSNLTYLEIKDIMGFGSVRATRNLLYRALGEIRKKLNLKP